MSEWVKVSDSQQVRVTGRVTMTIERRDGYWKWSVYNGASGVCDDDTGEYAHSEGEARIYAELNAI